MIDSDIQTRVFEVVQGYTLPNLEEVADLLGCDIGEVEDRLLDLNLEPCADCGLWCECCELDELQRCDQCQENRA